MKYFIPLLLGTVREGRQSEKAARYVLAKMQKHPEIETELIDPRNLSLPMTDEGEDLKVQNEYYRTTILRADGLVIVTPEYNHGYPGSLKRTLDILYDEYKHKPVAIAGVSSGTGSGIRVIEALLGVVRELGLVVSDEDLHFPRVEDLFDANGAIADAEKYEKRVARFLDELLWLVKAMKWGRENL